MDARNLSPDLIDALGITEFALRRHYGRDRGLNPIPSEAQMRALEKLNTKLHTKHAKSNRRSNSPMASSSSGWEEEEIQFDLKSATRNRVILFEGKVQKKNMTSLVSSTSKRYVILLNDVLLITSDQSSGDWGIIQSSTEKLVLHQVLDLDHLGIRDLHKYNKDENVCSFEVITPEQTLHLLAESEGDKSIWLEEIESAVFCIKSVQPWKNIGWQHEVIRGTMYSNAMYGDIEALKSSIESRLDMLGKSLDVCDESGMTALHWASMFGQLEAVELLVDHGAEIDILNSGMNSPAMLAAAFGRADIVIFLVGRGASVTTGLRNSVDMDCMLMAIMYGHSSAALYDVINLLQHKGVDINQFDSSGATPLQRCAANNIFRPMQALVDCGADVNMKHAVSGLTCLQIACSVPSPDPETVRSLLEKGAHPNWKDAFRRTSFDIVLDQHKAKLSRSTPSSPAKTMKETVDEVQDFAQIAMPALMELVRRGCRITPESIASLRPSFQEVIKSGIAVWDLATQPEAFPEFLSSLPDQRLSASRELWINNAASPNCLLCIEKFTYKNRRHHCRTCGALCCDFCSGKRLHSTAESAIRAAVKKKVDSSDGINSSSSSSASYMGERVCDGCFNKLSHECFLYQQAMAKIRKHEAKLAEANLEMELLKEAEASKHSLAKLFSSATIASPASSSNSNNKSKQTSSTAIGSAQLVATETRRALEMRGEKLQQFAEKSEMMRQGASDFKAMAAKLAQQKGNSVKKGWI